MPDAPTSPPLVASAPPARERISVPRRGTQPVRPAQPGTAAGFPITSQSRMMPPGMPPGFEVQAPSGTPAPPVSEVPRHPSFAPLPVEQQTVRAQAESLRRQLTGAVNHGQGLVASIDAMLTAWKDVDPALLTHEGIDVERIKQYRDAIDAALKLTA